MSSGKYLMSHPGGKKLHHQTPLPELLTPTLPAGPLSAVPFLNNEENNTAKGARLLSWFWFLEKSTVHLGHS